MPILTIAGIYTLIIGKLRISKHYGLKGKGARWAGIALIVFSLGLFSIPLTPFVILSGVWGLGETGVIIISFITQLIVFFAVLITLVRIFGNAYAKITK